MKNERKSHFEMKKKIKHAILENTEIKYFRLTKNTFLPFFVFKYLLG